MKSEKLDNFFFIHSYVGECGAKCIVGKTDPFFTILEQNKTSSQNNRKN